VRGGRLVALALGAVLLGVLGWAGGRSVVPPPGPAPADAQTPPGAHPGRAAYERHCATCHGATGQSDGPGAAALPIKPPPFTDGRLINPLPDEFLYQVIAEGAAAVGLAPQMPAFGRILSEREIRDVIAYVRTMATPAYEPRPLPPVAYLAPPPVQPVEFSHVVHAGSYGIACQYCHSEARRSTYAGLPSVARCMGCHKIVAAQGNPEIQKVQDYWKRQEPIPWVRIHKVAGFVHFPHKRHVAADLQCQLCHGPVERMQRVAQVAPLTMGWCVSCHAERKAPLDCVSCHH
jgi:mono/diheme cytochrome c family protein